MKYMLDMLRPLGDDRDSVPVHGLMPAKMKELDELQDSAYSDCPKGLLVGLFLGTLLWAVVIVSWLLLA